MQEFSHASAHSVCKVDDSLGIVYGFAIVCKVNGEDYYDLHGDHIPESVMAEAALDFMEKNRDGKVMHEGQVVGKVAFALPYTTDFAKSQGWPDTVTGLLIGWRPSDREMLKRFKAGGDLTGFSIGGFVPAGYLEEVK